MKKKMLLTCLSVILCFCLFAACDEEETKPTPTPTPPTITGIEVDGDFFDAKVVLKGTALPTTFSAVPVYSDNTKGAAVSLSSANISGYNKDATGEQEITFTYSTKTQKFKIIVADKIVASAAELRSEIDNLADNQYIAIKGGEYDLSRNQDKVYGNQTGWYMLIDKVGVTIKGIDNPTLTSTTQSANGAWASQNFITVISDNVTIDGVTIKSKKETNKAIEVVSANNFSLKNCTLAPNGEDYKFAGSLLFNTAVLNQKATVTNCQFNYGRISLSNADASFKLTLTDTTIDFANADDGSEYTGANEGYTSETYYWGIYNPKACVITATNSSITVSAAAKAHAEYASAFTDFLPTSGITIK